MEEVDGQVIQFVECESGLDIHKVVREDLDDDGRPKRTGTYSYLCLVFDFGELFFLFFIIQKKKKKKKLNNLKVNFRFIRHYLKGNI